MPCSKKFLANLSGLLTPLGLMDLRNCWMYEGMSWLHLQSAEYTVNKIFYSQLHPAFICTEMAKKLYYCLVLWGTMRTCLLFIGDGFWWLDWNIPTLTRGLGQWKNFCSRLTSTELASVKSIPYLCIHTKYVFNIHSLMLQKYFIYYISLFIFKYDFEV